MGMGIIAWIIFGALAGWIASMITGEREGCLQCVISGIAGALIGGFLFSFIGEKSVTGFNLWSLFVAVIGAIILIIIIRAIRR